MSGVNLFYTGESLQAAYLHPACAHDGKRETMRGTESNCESYLTQSISCVIGNIKTETKRPIRKQDRFTGFQILVS